MNNYCDVLFTNATVLQSSGEALTNQFVAIEAECIKATGDTKDVVAWQAKEVIDCQGELLTPGLIDCHTHLVYAGNRSDEFKRRLQGESYANIAISGGGILNTVAQTRGASLDELFVQSLPRIEKMIAHGVTTIEIKSGYGLDLETEIKMLQAAKALSKHCNIPVVSTFLGAHALPREYKAKPDAYIDLICQEMLPAVKAQGLAEMVDVFCENIGFSLNQSERVLQTAKNLGFKLKCHAEQLSNLGASQMAANLGALSTDHIEYLDEAGIKAMADNDTVGVLLPGAFYFLKEQTLPPIELLRKHQVAMAIATDCNPGSSPTTNLPLMMNMACVHFGLTVSEAWQAVTTNAARALGLESTIGKIESGYQANLVLWDCNNTADICYQFGEVSPQKIMLKGAFRAA